jgi:phenol hydroxylase P3 protein
MSWKEAWEIYFEQNGGALFADLARYGIRMPKYHEQAAKEKDHLSHIAWSIFYNFNHAAAIHTGARAARNGLAGAEVSRQLRHALPAAL